MDAKLYEQLSIALAALVQPMGKPPLPGPDDFYITVNEAGQDWHAMRFLPLEGTGATAVMLLEEFFVPRPVRRSLGEALVVRRIRPQYSWQIRRGLTGHIPLSDAQPFYPGASPRAYCRRVNATEPQLRQLLTELEDRAS